MYALTYQPQLLRGAIAEHLLQIGDGGRVYDRPVRWSAPFSALTAADIAGLDERGRSALKALDFAQCILAAAPQGVVALLDTRPTTAQEERAVRQLTPHFGPCLQAGARMTIVTPQLRAFLAEAAYREAYAARHRPADRGSE
jgi:hypothetical protein